MLTFFQADASPISVNSFPHHTSLGSTSPSPKRETSALSEGGSDRIEYAINQLDRTVRKVFERLLRNSVRQNITVFLCRWAIDRITSWPYCRWRSRLVDRLLMAIESRGGQDNV